MTIALSTELADRLASAAARHRLSAGQILEAALERWLVDERKDLEIFEALVDVDGGDRIAQEDMEAWADSLDSDNPLPLPMPRR